MNPNVDGRFNSVESAVESARTAQIMNSKIVERSIVHYTNKERGKRKLKKLKGHDALIHAARKHSNWMAQTKKFSHTGEKAVRLQTEHGHKATLTSL